MINIYRPNLRSAKGKIVFLLLLLLPLFAISQHNTCANSDFSQQNFVNWTGHTSVYPYNTPGTNIGTNAAPYPSPPYYYTAGIAAQRHTIITTATPDPLTCGNVMTLPPGEKQCVRLGNGGIGTWGNGVMWQREFLTYDFQISTSNSMVVYKYAAVLQDPIPFHDKQIKPRFIVSVMDLQSNIIDSVCGLTAIYSDSSAIFHTCDIKTADSLGGKVESEGNIMYTDWTTVALDLRKYTGKSIRLKFETWDCGLGGHFGYAYLTARCQEMKINASTCIPGGNVTLTAPEGFTYKWIPSGDITQSIVISNAKVGDSATVELISVNGCKSILKTFLFTNFPTADFSVDTSACAGTPMQFTDKSISGNGQWSWDFGDGTVADIQNPLHTYSTKGTYTVRLAIKNTDACTDTIVRSIYVCAPLGLNDSDHAPSFSVFPNPSTGLFKIESSSSNIGNVQVEITDLLGRLIYSEKNAAKNGLLPKEVDIKTQPDGIYFLTISSAEYSKVIKLIKKN